MPTCGLHPHRRIRALICFLSAICSKKCSQCSPFCSNKLESRFFCPSSSNHEPGQPEPPALRGPTSEDQGCSRRKPFFSPQRAGAGRQSRRNIHSLAKLSQRPFHLSSPSPHCHPQHTRDPHPSAPEDPFSGHRARPSLFLWSRTLSLPAHDKGPVSAHFTASSHLYTTSPAFVSCLLTATFCKQASQACRHRACLERLRSAAGRQPQEERRPWQQHASSTAHIQHRSGHGRHQDRRAQR